MYMNMYFYMPTVIYMASCRNVVRAQLAVNGPPDDHPAIVGPCGANGLGTAPNARLSPHQLPSDAVRVGRPVLCLVQLQRPPPSRAGRTVIAQRGVRVAESVQCGGFLIGVAEIVQHG